jgi:hypothetical protein
MTDQGYPRSARFPYSKAKFWVGSTRTAASKGAQRCPDARLAETLRPRVLADLPAEDTCQHSRFPFEESSDYAAPRSRQDKIGGGHEWLFSDNPQDNYPSRRAEEKKKGT